MPVLPIFFLLLMVGLFATFLMVLWPSSEQRVMQARITDIRNPRRSLHDETGDVELDDLEKGGIAERLGSYLKKFSLNAKLERLLLEANSPTTVGSLVLNAVAAGILAGLVAYLLLRSSLPSAGVAALGMLAPYVRLRWKRGKRLKATTAGLPDTADLMSRALRSGHSMTQTIELLGEQAPAPLGTEFARVFQEQKLGVPLRDVLVELGDRLPSRDLQFLITAILVQRETGGDLAAILDRTAGVLRERIQLQAQVQIHTAQGRLTGWILSLMPVVLLLMMTIFSPNYAHSLFSDPLGRKLLYGGAGFIVTGALVIRKIVGVQV